MGKKVYHLSILIPEKYFVYGQGILSGEISKVTEEKCENINEKNIKVFNYEYA